METLERNEASVTLLEFSVSDSSYPFVAGSEDEGRVTLQEILPRGEGEYREFFSQTDGDSEAFLGAVDAFESAEADLVADRDGENLFEIVVGDVCPIVSLAGHGALPRTVEAEDGEGRIVVEVPAHEDAGEVVDRFLEEHPEADLARKRQQPYGAPMFTRHDLEAVLEEHLTERQLEALTAAHESGYYERPRETTGRELAEELGVTQPTLRGHLRDAERALVSLVFEAAAADTAADGRDGAA